MARKQTRAQKTIPPKSSKRLPTLQGNTPLERAQDLIWHAFDEPDVAKKNLMAVEALKIAPDCGDAYVILAQSAASRPRNARVLYEKGIEAARRALGPKAFEEHAGHFWGILETRPYMRARHGLGLLLWDIGEVAGAIKQFSEMLRLNPNDNQGVRYVLATCLLYLERHADVEKLLAQYDEATAAFAYSEALLRFRLEGDSATSRGARAAAIRANRHVPEYLTVRIDLPEDRPDYIGVGDQNEAVSYVADAFDVWVPTPGAIEWLDAGTSKNATAMPSRRRLDS